MSHGIKKVIVGLSGGVDSSVAALLLLEKGFQVEALFMKNWEEDDNEVDCPTTQDLIDAQKTCDVLGIQLHTVNFSSEYWDNVFEHFLTEYRSGRTPNPDILCNREIKFKAFLKYGIKLEADYIATGHYAQTLFQSGYYLLKKANDLNKDQSYFLYSLGQTALSKSLFPIGHLSKPTVRKIAKEIGFQNFNKKDSTGICFIGERKFKKFLSKYLPAKPGHIETVDGKIIGKHDGLMFYTIGQRQGLGIGGQRQNENIPWYVIRKDLKRNTLIVGSGNNNPFLYSGSLNASQLHWVSGFPPQSHFQCAAKIRYRQKEEPCVVELTDEQNCVVSFKTPQRAITPGQSIVFYQEEVCLGGGIIN